MYYSWRKIIKNCQYFVCIRVHSLYIILCGSTFGFNYISNSVYIGLCRHSTSGFSFSCRKVQIARRLPVHRFVTHLKSVHWHRFTYLIARFAVVSKRNVLWVVLKHRLNTWILARFYYVDIGTYCSVFITLLQVSNALVQNIRCLSIKLNALSCWKYICPTPNPSLNLPIVLTNAKLT